MRSFIRTTIARLTGSAFVRSFATLVSGNGTAQLVNLATIPVITRLYSPDSLGVLGVFTAIVLIFANAGTFRFDLALVLPRKQEDAHNLFWLASAALLASTACVTVLVLSAGHTIASVFRMPDLEPQVWCVPVTIMLFGLKNVLINYRIRQRAFPALAAERVLFISACHVTQIAYAVTFGPSFAGLVSGFMTGTLAGVVFLWVRPSILPFRKVLDDFNPAGIRQLLSTYRQFPIFATVNIVLLHLSRSLVLFLFSAFFTPAVVGYYSLANRVLFQPLYLLSGSLQIVLLQSSSARLNESSPIRPILWKSVAGLSVLGIIPAVALTGFGPSLFALFLGAQWREAGEYAQILSPFFFLVLATSPANQIFNVTKQMLLTLVLTIVTIAGSTASIVAGGFIAEDVLTSLVLFSIFNSLMRIVVLTVADRVSARSDRLGSARKAAEAANLS